MDETREENNKEKGPFIDRVPLRQTVFVIGLLGFLVSGAFISM